jgi:repressor LexA
MVNEKARAIYDYICRCTEERGFPPTIREIGEEFAIRSTNGVRHYLKVLEQAGYLRRSARIARALEPIVRPRGEVADRRPSPGRPSSLAPMAGAALAAASAPAGIPLLGRVAAGTPLLAEENVESHLQLDDVFPAARGDLFALRVKGLSMKDRGILDGDLLVVRKQEHARDGDAVVALVGDDATVKTYRRTADAVELIPENPDFSTLRLGPQDDFRIVGVVVGLIRPPSGVRH